MNYLITGMAGTGKTTLANELNRHGLIAYDLDNIPGACAWAEKKTGKIVTVPENAPEGWSSRHNWVWNPKVIEELLSQPDDVFIVGVSSNFRDFYPRFDKTFVLSVDDETIHYRLTTRTNNSYGKDPTELAHVLKHHRNFVTEQAGYGAIILDGTLDTSAIIDKVLAHTHYDS